MIGESKQKNPSELHVGGGVLKSFVMGTCSPNTAIHFLGLAIAIAERLKIQISILTLIPLKSLNSVELLIQFNPNLSTLCAVVGST